MTELDHHLTAAPLDLIVQEYVTGHEFGVFYIRNPSESRGRIFSITEKQFPVVTGDGRRSLEELILADDRAVCLRNVYGRIHAATLQNVPRRGARIPLVEIGSHCRGSRFVDAATMATPETASSVWTAWRVLCQQWRLAFEIGAENRPRGHEPTRVSVLFASALAYRGVARRHPQPASRPDVSDSWRPSDCARDLTAA
jgi:hypothetical protein